MESEKQIVTELITAVKEASPIIWEAARDKTTAEILLSVVWLNISISILYGIWRYAITVRRADDDDIIVFSYGVALASSVIPFLLMGFSIDRIVYGIFSFEYAVIQNVTELLK